MSPRGRHDGRRRYDWAYVLELAEVPLLVLFVLGIGLVAMRLMEGLVP